MQTHLRKFYENHLVDCINQQCKATKAHIDEHREHIAVNRHSSGYSDAWKQLTFALCSNRAEDAYLFDLDGNKYLDITMGFGVHLFGHSPAFLSKVLHEQLERGSSLGPVHPLAGETAALLCRMTGNERCAFFNSGTEAIMVALRLARAATQKPKVVIFEGAYHGTHDSLLAIKQHPVTREAIGSIPGVSNSLVKDTILLPFGKQESLDFIAENAGEIAAVLTEPVRSRHPEEINPVFLRQLQKICDTRNISFILDEVITGFRLANAGAKSLFSLDPGMTVYGKILGGGLPIGAVAGKKKYLDYIDGGNWSFSDDSGPYSPTTFVAGTFCHHPLTMAASKAALSFLSVNGDRLQNELNERTTRFCQSINDFCNRLQIPVQLVHFGSLFRFITRGKTKIFYHALLKEKVYVWEGRNCFLSAAHQQGEMQQLEERVRKSLLEMRAAGFFPLPDNKTEPLAGKHVFLQTGFEISELLSPDAIQFAFNYAVENAGFVNETDLRKEFLFHPDGIRDETITIARTDIRLLMCYRDNKTFLLLQFEKKHFDGWSMILFIRFFNDCFVALEKKRSLPSHPFTPKSLFNDWVTRHGTRPFELFPASSLHRYLPGSGIKHEGTLFEFLLACFAIALGEGEYSIGIPFSGQLVSRHIHTIGHCTCHIPVSMTIAGTTTPASLIDTISSQLKQARKDFRNWYNKDDQPPVSIVFNMDQVGQHFSFGQKETKWAPVSDPNTSHDIFCNVIAEPAGLYVTIKYKTAYPVKKIEHILDQFSALIVQNESILTYSK